MTTTLFNTRDGGRAALRARWQRSPSGELVCTWVAEAAPPVAQLRRPTPIRLTGRRHLASTSAALRALTAALARPDTAA
jgi:hypothetical protein